MTTDPEYPPAPPEPDLACALESGGAVASSLEAAAWPSVGGPDTDHGRRTDSTADIPAVRAAVVPLVADPVAGADFHGFRLVEEIGRGAFSRVYLAQQVALGNRPVVVKVTATSDRESRTLAGLCHPHIVPVHSTHPVGGHQIVCMPFLGTATLADVYRTLEDMTRLPVSGYLFAPPPAGAAADPTAADPVAELTRLTGRRYVEAVLRVGAGLAAALAHAHDRGIVHRDLKPANVLLADDGRPVLLDFNLSAPATVPGDEGRGGTPHYMAPEQQAAFAGTATAVDGRADLYALGVVLYELLTRRSPFPRYKATDAVTLRRMTADRAGPPPRLRGHNRAVSPAAEAIVRRCLEPDPARRYQTGHELADDLSRHLAHRPLRYAAEPSAGERVRKWGRRNRHLLSAAAVMVIAATTVATDRYSGHAARLAQLEADAAARAFGAEAQVAAALLADGTDRAGQDEGVRRAEAALARFGPAGGHRAGELLTLLGRVTAARAVADAGRADPIPALRRALDRAVAAQGCYPPGAEPRAVWELQADVSRLLGRADDARRLARVAADRPADGPTDKLLRAHRHLEAGEHRPAVTLLAAVVAADPQHLAARYLLGVCHGQLGQPEAAEACFATCAALRPDFERPGRLAAR